MDDTDKKLQQFFESAPTLFRSLLRETCKFLNDEKVDSKFVYIGSAIVFRRNRKSVEYKLAIRKVKRGSTEAQDKSIVAVIHDRGLDKQGDHVIGWEHFDETDADNIEVAVQKAMAVLNIENGNPDHNDLPPIPGW